MQVLQGIQNGPYGNIYNPENFFVGSQGSGAANNWAAGYSAGETVQDEVFDMIDREADGSDSLEVQRQFPLDRLTFGIGVYAATLYSRWHRIRTWKLHP